MRAMKPYDADGVLEAVLGLRLESPVYGVIPDTQRGRDHILTVVENGLKCGAYFGVIEPYRGFILGGIGGVWYDVHQKHAYEQLLYVRPAFRNTSLAVRLVKEFEEEAKRQGCNKIFAGSTTGIQDERVLKLYQRLGWSTSNPSVEKDLCAYRDLIP